MVKKFLTQNDEDVLVQTSSMKLHVTETHEHNFEIHNIVLSSQSISLSVEEEEESGYAQLSVECYCITRQEKHD